MDIALSDFANTKGIIVVKGAWLGKRERTCDSLGWQQMFRQLPSYARPGQWPIHSRDCLNMDTTLKPYIAAIGFVIVALGHPAHAQPDQSVKYSQSMTEKYSQKTLLKNWALSVCLAKVSKDIGTTEDANATASAYLEFGQQPIESYDALRELAERYANRKYGGSIKSEFNTMKCIDLFHSKELDILTRKLSKNK